MVSKQQGLTWLVGIALFFTATWAYLAYDIMTVSNRTPVDTTAQDPSTLIDQDISEVSSKVEFEEFNEMHEALTPPTSEEVPQVPQVEERIPGSTLSEEAIADLGIEEPLLEEQVFYATATPNDTIYPQWYTTTISAPTAWDRSTGTGDTLVAVIDSGYALDHEDLSAAWFTNDGEQGLTANGEVCWTGTPADKQTNGCDDDQNGFIDDWRGWDFSNNDNNPQAGENYAPGANHGTKSAGLIGARGDNNVGVASVNWNTQLLPLQGLFDEGFGYSTDITAAIYYAVEMGADVINMSLGGPTPDSFTLAAVRYAQQNNVIVVASAGNCGVNQTDPNCIGYPSPGGMGYPARYAETIAVGATTSSDARASFSSFGAEIDIVAPGSGSIRTTSWSTSNGTSLYSTSSFGTSFSAPIVSGAIALIKGEYPEITADEIIALFQGSADKVAGMSGEDWTEEYGWGRLNVDALFDSLDEYQRQLLKTGGSAVNQNTSTQPLISTNRGHSSASAITTTNTAYTYCVTTPQTLCRLRLDRVGSSQVEIFDQLRSNNQGIAVFEWSSSGITNGTWDATVTANGQTSTTERLIVQ